MISLRLLMLLAHLRKKMPKYLVHILTSNAQVAIEADTKEDAIYKATKCHKIEYIMDVTGGVGEPIHMVAIEAPEQPKVSPPGESKKSLCSLTRTEVFEPPFLALSWCNSGAVSVQNPHYTIETIDSLDSFTPIYGTG
jgi:hypothetical protein